MSRNNIIFRTTYTSSFKNTEQLIIRVGKWCNFKCIFCNVANNEKILETKPKIKEILAFTFYRIKFSNFKSKYLNVTISWWEPSIFQTETIFILKYFTSYFKKKFVNVFFDLQTNASNIDLNFAKNLKDNWISSSMVSFHTINPIDYYKLIWVKYEIFWEKVFLWVRNLIDSWIDVSFNIVLNNITKDSFFDTIKYLIDNFPEVISYNIWFFQPHWMAQNNYDDLFVSYSEISFIYNKALAYIKYMWKKASSHYVWLPLCYLNDFSDSLEYFTNKNLIKDWIDSETLIHTINDTNKNHKPECKNCIYKRFCSGIWRWFGDDHKLNPYYYFKFFEPYNIKICKHYTYWDNLKKIYDSWIRQIFIDYNDYIILKESIKKLNFFVISVIWFNNFFDFDINDFIWCNIQFDFLNNDLINFIFNVIEFNKLKSFHFHITIDINLSIIDEDLLSKIPFNDNIKVNFINVNRTKILDNSGFYFYYK